MITEVRTKPLPGPKSFFGLKNIRDMGQKGMLDFIAQQWREHGDLFAVQVGPQKLVIVIQPEHIRHITITIPGHQRVRGITIDKELLTPDEAEFLQDMLMAGINAAIELSLIHI